MSTLQLLPTLDGYVHGIVSIDPLRIQCDACGAIAVHDGSCTSALFVILCGIEFRTLPNDGRRLCLECRTAEGWV